MSESMGGSTGGRKGFGGFPGANAVPDRPVPIKVRESGIANDTVGSILQDGVESGFGNVRDRVAGMGKQDASTPKTAAEGHLGTDKGLLKDELVNMTGTEGLKYFQGVAESSRDGGEKKGGIKGFFSRLLGGGRNENT